MIAVAGRIVRLVVVIIVIKLPVAEKIDAGVVVSDCSSSAVGEICAAAPQRRRRAHTGSERFGGLPFGIVSDR